MAPNDKLLQKQLITQMAHCGIYFATSIFVKLVNISPCFSRRGYIPPSSLIILLLEEVHTQKDTEEVEMAQNIEYLHSDIFSVLAKEKELRGNGYRSKNLLDENLLERDEYLLRAPIRKSSSAQIGWHYTSIIWRTP